MDDYKSETNPEVLTWARKTAGYAIDDVVAELADQTVTADTVRAWECGDDSPMYLTQFKKLTRIYNRSEFLFFRSKPPVDDTLARLSSLPNYIKEQLPPQVRFLHREARLMQIYLEEFLVDRPPPMIPLRGIATLDDEVSGLACKVRTRLGSTLAKQKNWQNSVVALNKWRTAIETTGIWVFFGDFADENYAGFYMEDAKYPVIFIDNGLTIERQIFALIHELGRVLLAPGGMFIRGELVQSIAAEYQTIEQFCADFATELLVPTADLNRIDKVDVTRIGEYANLYKVSEELLAQRCLDIGVLDSQCYTALLSTWNKHETHNPSMQPEANFLRTKFKCLGKKFLLLALSQYEPGEMSELKIADYLEVTISQLEGLEALVYAQDADLEELQAEHENRAASTMNFPGFKQLDEI